MSMEKVVNGVDVLPKTKAEKKKIIEDAVEGMLEGMKDLPTHAMLSNLNNYDYASILLLMRKILELIEE